MRKIVSLTDSLACGLVKKDLAGAESQDYFTIPYKRESREVLLYIVIDGKLVEGDRFACFCKVFDRIVSRFAGQGKIESVA